MRASFNAFSTLSASLAIAPHNIATTVRCSHIVSPVAKSAKSSLASPEILPARAKQETALHVVIETPKGSRNKYKFEPKLRSYALSNVLPEGMAFPYDFGFIPQTEADDGDPLDVLLLMDAPAFPGCVVESRL